jgi:hypothetical protein
MKVSINNGVVAPTVGFNSSDNQKTSITPFGVHAARYTDEDIIEQILQIKASKEEILIALRETYPEKFI